jgi:hypothetical protein
MNEMETAEKPASVTLMDLPVELLEIIISYVEISTPVPEKPKRISLFFSDEVENPTPWATDRPGMNPKALQMAKDTDVVHSGNWREQVRKMETLSGLASTCRLLKDLIKLPRHLFINLYSPRTGTLQRRTACKPFARTDDAGLIEVSSKPIYPMFRLVPPLQVCDVCVSMTDNLLQRHVVTELCRSISGRRNMSCRIRGCTTVSRILQNPVSSISMSGCETSSTSATPAQDTWEDCSRDCVMSRRSLNECERSV